MHRGKAEEEGDREVFKNAMRVCRHIYGVEGRDRV